MAASGAIVSLGTVLSCKLATTSGAIDAAFTDIAELVDFDGPFPEATIIEVTNLSSGQFRQWKRGIVDLGELEGTLRLIPTATAGGSSTRNHYDLLKELSIDAGRTLANINAVVPNFKLTFPTTVAITWTFAGFVRSLGVRGSVDNPLETPIRIKVTDDIGSDGISIA